jgi:hypothetical protein
MSQADNTDKFPPATRSFGEDEYYNMSAASAAAGYSQAGFRRMLRRLEEKGERIPTYTFPGGGREVFIKKQDLINYFKPRLVQPEE